MLDRFEDKMQPWQGLSALADGELDAAATKLACAHWRDRADARARWHAYHLIGDVMRSEELAADAARDAAFLASLRQRLTAEAVVLAPPAADASGARGRSRRRAGVGVRWSWVAPAAVAAGFMAVASVLVVTRGTAPPGGTGETLAQSLLGKGAVVATAMPTVGAASMVSTDQPVEPQTYLADDKLVRDARLEGYFAAHKQFGGSSALGVPSGFLRAATTQSPGR